MASRASRQLDPSFDTQHFITLFVQFLRHHKDYMGSSAHGSFLSWLYPSPEGDLRWPEKKNMCMVKSLDHPPLPLPTNWAMTYFSSALRTGGKPPRLCLYTVSRIWQPWICGKYSIFKLDPILIVHVHKLIFYIQSKGQNPAENEDKLSHKI